jgi:hypothetical protein
MFSSMSSAASIYNYRQDYRIDLLRIDQKPRDTYRGGQVQHRLACDEGFFVVVFDLYINYVHSAIEFTPA